jgi:glycogen debranching enzyme
MLRPCHVFDHPYVSFGREIAGDLAVAETREWLVTNGLGGFASGTVSGHLTRRFHGLLVAALRPPLGRTLLVTKSDETAGYNGKTYSLATNRWRSGAVDPAGYRLIEEFHLDGTSLMGTYACADARLTKTIWMEQGANTTYVRYHLESASRRLKLQIKALVNYRDFYSLTQAGGWRMDIRQVERGLRVLAHLRVWNDPAAAARDLEPMIHELQTHGLGSASEIFDGDAPFTPRGSIAQAWTVAELLRAWEKITSYAQPRTRS